jgi:hypothetical protein
MQQLYFYSKRFGEYRTLVDDEDFQRLKELKNLKWCVVKKRGHIYFQKRLSGKKLVELHRWIMNTPKGMYTDHINQNTLDNRKCNLRICLNSANLRNGRIRTNNKSGFTGVFFIKKHKKWIAFIKVHYKRYHLGYFNTINKAIKARKIAEHKYWSD